MIRHRKNRGTFDQARKKEDDSKIPEQTVCKLKRRRGNWAVNIGAHAYRLFLV